MKIDPMSATTHKVIRHGDRCSAINCTNSRGMNPGLSFFTFPKDAERCKLWMINCRRADWEKKNPANMLGHKLCENHFEPSQFMNPAEKGVPKPRKNLIHNAIPTIFPVLNPPKPVTLKCSLSTKLQFASKMTVSACIGMNEESMFIIKTEPNSEDDEESELVIKQELDSESDINSDQEFNSEFEVTSNNIKVESEEFNNVTVEQDDTQFQNTDEINCWMKVETEIHDYHINTRYGLSVPKQKRKISRKRTSDSSSNLTKPKRTKKRKKKIKTKKASMSTLMEMEIESKELAMESEELPLPVVRRKVKNCRFFKKVNSKKTTVRQTKRERLHAQRISARRKHYADRRKVLSNTIFVPLKTLLYYQPLSDYKIVHNPIRPASKRKFHDNDLSSSEHENGSTTAELDDFIVLRPRNTRKCTKFKRIL